ncbi:hypothetical protein N7493_008310 [Penicillium malachiteum]|uniref:Thioredoxin domain-containing protein n=1 Tax=Penicillium malachiteum TaxID=1324776 RepID=A0AAD6HHK8_9EURO|nr:hypothetical protein N7493_008310 [Penicillium malachiteum]
MELKTIIFIAVAWIIYNIYRSRKAAATPMEAHGKVTNIDNEVIFKALISSGPTVIDFYATWCGPCRAVGPQVGKLSEKYDKVRFIQIDVDKMGGAARQFSVTAMPTFVVMNGGAEVERVVGGDIRKLDAAIQKVSP